MMKMYKAGQRVIINNPRNFGGGTSCFTGRTGKLTKVSGRFCSLVLDGELDELGFFSDEFDLLTET